jgi:adenylate cyclase
MSASPRRTFLVHESKFPAGARVDATVVTLGWLAIDPEVTVRFVESPIDGRRGYTNQDRHAEEPTPLERERRIEAYEANELLEKCALKIKKTRYRAKVGDVLWDVEAYDSLDELWLASCDLEPHASFDKPAWLDREVSGDERYRDVALARAGHAPA